VIAAAIVGSHVKIGNAVRVGERCIIKDCCEILDNAVLADDTVVPPLVVMGGVPAQIVGYLHESAAFQRERENRILYSERLPGK
jgi:dynactin-5